MRLFRGKKLPIVSLISLTLISVFIVLNWKSDNKLIGAIIKFFAPRSYKYLMQQSRLSWFSGLALDQDLPLHVASGWNYLSETQFNEIIDHVTDHITIHKHDSIFELGCGTGAALLRIKYKYGVRTIGGSDLSSEAIERIGTIFPEQKSHFHVISMTEQDDGVQDESQDVVLSFGAFAMYLYREDMEIALKEALRMAKIGGRLCFTHFIEPNGKFLGTILEPLPKSQWWDWARKYSLKDLKIDQMIHQRDRYFVCFSK